MFGLSIAEISLLFILLVVYVGLVAVPTAMICRRIGKPWWLGVFALVPAANVALLWFIAVARWNNPSASSRAA